MQYNICANSYYAGIVIILFAYSQVNRIMALKLSVSDQSKEEERKQRKVDTFIQKSFTVRIYDVY